MKLSSSGFVQHTQEGEKWCLNSELWHACAGPLVSLPAIGSRVVYFPQGHSEQGSSTSLTLNMGHTATGVMTLPTTLMNMLALTVTSACIQIRMHNIISSGIIYNLTNL